MTFLADLFGLLAFRERALRSLAERGAFAWGMAIFAIGFLAYTLVRNSVYADLPEIVAHRSGPVGFFWDLNLVQSILFLLLIYIPGVIILSNAITERGRGFSVSREEYGEQSSVLLAAWGLLCLIAAPVQWLVPHFLIIGMLEISFGMLIRLVLVLTYTVWAIKQLNNLSPAQSIGVFVLSWFTLPVYYLLVDKI